MDPHRFRRIAEIFEAAWRTPRADRDAYVERACAGDAQLRNRVASLLIHFENSTDPLKSDWMHRAVAADPRFQEALAPLLADELRGSSAMEATHSRAPHERSPRIMSDESPPAIIDRYELHERLGEGGFGEVFRARQTKPIVRDVALKLIKPGMDSRQVVTRFEAERQALALMDHPAIARVFDAGTTPAGRPFFVMELVRGLPITEYAATHKLGIRERLALFVQVCQAVQHAHQKGVIHRDLKPGNILVVDEGREGAGREGEKQQDAVSNAPSRPAPRALPKIIDFGIAKATQQSLTEHTLETLAGHLVGTPTYMSPEQVDLRTADIDTRTDVYSLGVVLYELLSGMLPFDIARVTRGGLPELLRTIREVDPLPPGTYAPAVRGELDWIVLKCLEKDRARRYQTAGAISDDIERFLRHEPVTARPQTVWYRSRKFIRRNRLLVGALAAVFIALMLGVIATAWQALRVANERDRTAEQALRARETADLLSRVIQSANPEFARGSNPTVREMLDTASRDLEADSTVHPLVAADAHASFAAAYLALAHYGRATTHARRAIALRRERLGPDHAETLEATDTLIRALSLLDQDDEAVRIAHADALERSRAALGPDHPISIMLTITCAYALCNATEVDRAEVLRLSRDAYERSLAIYGRDDSRSLHAEADFALELMQADQLDESERLLRHVLETRQRTLPADHPLLITSMFNVMAVLDQRGDAAAALELAGPLLEMAERVLGPDDPRTANYLLNIARVESQAGRREKSEPLARRALDISTARLGPVHPQTLSSRGVLAVNLIELKRFSEAEPIVKEHYDLCLAEFGPAHKHTIQAITLLYDLAQARGNVPEMRRWAETLRGTPFEEAAFQQLREAEAAASQPASSPP